MTIYTTRTKRSPGRSSESSFSKRSSSKNQFKNTKNSAFSARKENSGTRHAYSSSDGRSNFSTRRNTFSSNRGSKRNGHKSDFIDETRFINKVDALHEEPVYVPKNTFSDFNIHELLSRNLEKKCFINPSPIQDQAIPVLLEGKDVIGIASTGTGKTAAFLIPIINKFVHDRHHQALVLTPTRELAQQIEDEFRIFTAGMRLYSVSAVGGLPINKQIKEIELGVHIVIGTPGRVKDLIARGKLDVSNFNTVVLDEADRMLDMGFVDDMREILGAMPNDKHGMFFSATFSSSIKTLCNDFLKSPITISLKTRDTSASVDQDIVRVPRGTEKMDVLYDLLNNSEFKKVLIFRETKRHVDELARELRNAGYSALAIHGDMRSRERMRTVDAFTKGKVKIVVATDVAARGIDIPDITHVINYDIPSTYDTYVHRIGRTGRANKKGVALTFVR